MNVVASLSPGEPDVAIPARRAVKQQEWLIDRFLFHQELERYALPRGTHSLTMNRLRRLRRRRASGALRVAGSIEVTETRSQQAFNRLLFLETLGYRDVLHDPPTYSLITEVGFTGAIPDVSLGQFSTATGDVQAVVELKTAGADLIAEQATYKKLNGKRPTPIEQVLHARRLAKASWAIATNMYELYLFHESSDQVALYANLLTLTPDRVRWLHFVFGVGGLVSTKEPSRMSQLVVRAKRLRSIA